MPFRAVPGSAVPGAARPGAVGGAAPPPTTAAATLRGAGTVAAPAFQRAGATLSAGGSLTAGATQRAAATLTGSGTVTASTGVFQRGTAWPLAQVTGSGQQSVTGNWPSGGTPQRGDLLVAWVWAYGTTGITIGSPPPGWTRQIDAIGSTTTGVFVYTRIAAGNDPAPTFSCTLNGTGNDNKLVVGLQVLYDTSGLTPSLNAYGWEYGTSGAFTIDSGIVDVAGGMALAGTIASDGTNSSSTTWTVPAGWAEAASQSGAAAAECELLYMTGRPAVGSPVAVTFTHSMASTEQAAVILTVTPAASQPTSALSDDFSTDDLAVKWGNSLAASIDTANQRAVIQTGTTPSTFDGLSPTVPYNLTGSYVYAKVTPPLPDPLLDRLTYLNVKDTSGALEVRFGYDAGNLVCILFDGYGGGDTKLSIPYSATSHAWLKLSESGGSITAWTSPDGITWTSQVTFSYATPATSVWPTVLAYYTSASDSNADAYVAGFNIPVVAGTAALGAAGTVAAGAAVSSPAGITGRGAFRAAATLPQGASLAAAGQVAAPRSAQRAGAAIAGRGAVGANGQPVEGATLTAAGAVASAGGVAAGATLTAGGAVKAGGPAQGAASLAGTGAVGAGSAVAPTGALRASGAVDAGGATEAAAAIAGHTSVRAGGETGGAADLAAAGEVIAAAGTKVGVNSGAFLDFIP